MALVFAGVTGSAAMSAAPVEHAFERVVARFNNTAQPAYRAYRRLEAGIPGTSRYARLEAWTELQPGRGLTYEVTHEEGSEYVRNKVLRKLLESEQELIAHGKPLRAALNEQNYTFGDVGVTESGLQRVQLTAARNGHGIVNGSVLLDPDEGRVVRIEGRLVKSPSFWVRDVDVVWKFTEIGGHALPTEMSSKGRVRMFGGSSFRMTYEYVAIDGRPTGATVRAALR